MRSSATAAAPIIVLPDSEDDISLPTPSQVFTAGPEEPPPASLQASGVAQQPHIVNVEEEDLYSVSSDYADPSWSRRQRSPDATPVRDIAGPRTAWPPLLDEEEEEEEVTMSDPEAAEDAAAAIDNAQELAEAMPTGEDGETSTVDLGAREEGTVVVQGTEDPEDVPDRDVQLNTPDDEAIDDVVDDEKLEQDLDELEEEDTDLSEPLIELEPVPQHLSEPDESEARSSAPRELLQQYYDEILRSLDEATLPFPDKAAIYDAVKIFLADRLEPIFRPARETTSEQWSYSDSAVHSDFLALKDEAARIPSIDPALLEIPSGSYDDDVICLLNYPTFNAETIRYGQVDDRLNKTMQRLSKAMLGFDNVLLLDAIPYVHP